MARWLTAAAVAGLVAVVAALTVTRSWGHGTGGHDASRRDSAAGSTTSAGATAPPASPAAQVPPPAPATPVPPGSAHGAPRPFVASGTVLLTCDSVSPGRLKPDWRAGSLRVGTLWLVGGRHLGYARLGRPGPAYQGRDGRPASQGAGASAGYGRLSRDVEMRVHVDAGATVVMRAAAGTLGYFEFLNSPASIGDYQGLDGGRGYTFVPCPVANAGSGGTDFYDVGFSIAPGHTAAVEVWTSTDARPVWLTFTTPTSR